MSHRPPRRFSPAPLTAFVVPAFVITAFVGAGLAAPALAGGDDPAFGFWLTASRRAIVELAPCGASACATVVWLLAPLDEAGRPAVDFRNEDPALRDRKICGLSLMSGFSRTAPGVWENGQIYNGEDGQTYSADFELQDGGDLRVRGYVGLPIFGKTRIWTREADARGGCAGAESG